MLCDLSPVFIYLQVFHRVQIPVGIQGIGDAEGLCRVVRVKGSDEGQRSVCHDLILPNAVNAAAIQNAVVFRAKPRVVPVSLPYHTDRVSLAANRGSHVQHTVAVGDPRNGEALIGLVKGGKGDIHHPGQRVQRIHLRDVAGDVLPGQIGKVVDHSKLWRRIHGFVGIDLLRLRPALAVVVRGKEPESVCRSAFIHADPNGEHGAVREGNKLGACLGIRIGQPIRLRGSPNRALIPVETGTACQIGKVLLSERAQVIGIEFIHDSFRKVGGVSLLRVFDPDSFLQGPILGILEEQKCNLGVCIQHCLKLEIVRSSAGNIPSGIQRSLQTAAERQNLINAYAQARADGYLAGQADVWRKLLCLRRNVQICLCFDGAGKLSFKKHRNRAEIEGEGPALRGISVDDHSGIQPDDPSLRCQIALCITYDLKAGFDANGTFSHRGKLAELLLDGLMIIV